MEEEYHFDPESVVLRRADPDDCDAIINLVEIGEDDIYNRVYSYPKILKLIETAYLAITVIDRNTGSVVGFAAFEDFPQVSSLSSSLNAGLLCAPHFADDLNLVCAGHQSVTVCSGACGAPCDWLKSPTLAEN
jgi:hypothetical protein